MNITFPDSHDSTSAYLQSAFNSCICTGSPYGVKEFIKHKAELAGVDKKNSLYTVHYKTCMEKKRLLDE